MQTRTITVDYARPRGYDVGYRAENNFTLLALPIPAELEGADSYRVYFESTVGKYLQTELLTPTDGYVTVKITSDIVPEPGNMAAQLVAFADGEIVGYAPTITGTAKVSIPDGTERLSHSLAAEIALNTAARHSHDNKSVLDKFAETDGKLQYNGSDVGLKGDTGAPGKDGKDGTNGITPTIGTNGNWYIGSTDTGKPSRGEKGEPGEGTYYVELDGNYPSYTLSETTPLADIAAAYNEGKALFCRCTRDSQTVTLPLFGSIPESNVWVFSGSVGVAYIDLPVQYFSIFVSHLGVIAETKMLSQQLKITVGNTEYLYDGSEAVSVTVKAPVQLVATAGKNITLDDNTEYRLDNVTTLTLTYPTSLFECWMRLSFAASGNITVTLPTDTKYIGTAPDFKNGETWELSFKDKVLAAQKVGEGT